jgi:hypothetical protein
MANTKALTTEESMAELVESIAVKSFGGTLPDCAEVIAIAVTVTVWPLQEASEEVTARFIEDFLLHLRARIAMQNNSWLS